MLPTQLVTVTVTAMPWFFIRSTRALSLKAEMKLTAMMTAKTPRKDGGGDEPEAVADCGARPDREERAVSKNPTMTVRLPSVNV